MTLLSSTQKKLRRQSRNYVTHGQKYCSERWQQLACKCKKTNIRSTSSLLLWAPRSPRCIDHSIHTLTYTYARLFLTHPQQIAININTFITKRRHSYFYTDKIELSVYSNKVHFKTIGSEITSLLFIRALLCQ